MRLGNLKVVGYYSPMFEGRTFGNKGAMKSAESALVKRNEKKEFKNKLEKLQNKFGKNR